MVCCTARDAFDAIRCSSVKMLLDIAEAVTMMQPCQLVRGDCVYQIESEADEIFFIVSDSVLHVQSPIYDPIVVRSVNRMAFNVAFLLSVRMTERLKLPGQMLEYQGTPDRPTQS